MSIFITPHFRWSEALCTNTGLPNLPNDYAKANLVSTFRILELVRIHCNFPLKINSAYRSVAVNKRVYELQKKKVNENSYHLDGRAIDISIVNLTDKQVDLLYQSLLSHFPVEIYKTTTFIHVAF